MRFNTSIHCRKLVIKYFRFELLAYSDRAVIEAKQSSFITYDFVLGLVLYVASSLYGYPDMYWPHVTDIVVCLFCRLGSAFGRGNLICGLFSGVIA